MTAISRLLFCMSAQKPVSRSCDILRERVRGAEAAYLDAQAILEGVVREWSNGRYGKSLRIAHELHDQHVGEYMRILRIFRNAGLDRARLPNRGRLSA